ncbi:Uncharacterised protein [Halioglobus japonicus]|nr:Uncharacterised protein [Halioglobus japonicus]
MIAGMLKPAKGRGASIAAFTDYLIALQGGIVSSGLETSVRL